jgi:hypothetical protein
MVHPSKKVAMDKEEWFSYPKTCENFDLDAY